ncbi:MAG: hypothetical protein IJC93_04310 [Clostridia bacterium]|nr:hypothetical protein [Clostridia bacterium]
MERFAHRGRNLCFVIAVLAFLLIVPLATLLAPKAEVSGVENRSLAKVPEYTADDFFSGDYFLAWEDYFKDHIALRDAQILASTWLKLHVLDRTDVNDILVTDEVLLPDLNAPNTQPVGEITAEAMGDRLAGLRDTIETYGGTFLYIGVPTQMTAWADAFPAGSVDKIAERAEKGVAFAAALSDRGIDMLDMAEVFTENGGIRQYYMRTDHHYTLKGAYLVYRAICGHLTAAGYEIPVLEENDLTFSALPLRFLGSRDRAVYYLSGLNDPVYAAELAEPIAFTRTDNGAAVAAKVFHLPGDDCSKVSYDLYMGGDIAETVIDTNRDELPSVLIFGDSYTNAVETLLYASFDEMRSLDLRHYQKMALSEYIEQYKPDIVICLRDDNNYLVGIGNGNIR